MNKSLPDEVGVQNQIENILNEFQQQMARHTELHAGYPLNLAYDYTPLLPFLQYTLLNMGDPFVNGSYKIHSREFERQCLAWFAQLYELDSHWGYVTSGGTEGNLYSLFLARELYPDAVLYASADTHYSIAKAARLSKIPHVVINSQPHGEIDYEHLEQELTSRRHLSAIVSLNLGTTMKGAVDSIDQTLEILDRLKMRFHLHCDGALGGLLLPFIETAPRISFQNYPIGSIAVSGHKFIGSPIPYGIVLTRQEYVNKIATSIEYIGSTDTTITGSRNGLAPLLLWYAITTRSHQFIKEVANCLQNAQHLRERLIQIGYSPLLNDFSTTVCFEKPSTELCSKWQLATVGNLAHVIVMQNFGTRQINNLTKDLFKEKITYPTFPQLLLNT